MKQKLELVPLTLYPIKEPYKPSYSKLMAELEVDTKRAQIEKEKKRKQKEEAKKSQTFASRLISWFWYLFLPTGFYFLFVDPIILILMIVFVILMAYIRNLASKCFQLDQVILALVTHSPCLGHTLVTHPLTKEHFKA